MYSFDGTFKSAPQVSLGNYQSATAKDIVRASRQARETREKSRSAEKAIVKLQSWARSFICRARLRKHRRSIIAVKLKNENREDECQMIYLIQFVFDPQIDTPLWVAFSRQLVTMKQSLLPTLKTRSPQGWTFFIRSIFEICKKHIAYCSERNEVMTASLRMLEFLSQNTNALSANSAEKLFSIGFFTTLLVSLKSKLPVAIIDDSEACKRTEMYKFMLQIFKAVLSENPTQSHTRETRLLRELFLSENDAEYALLLTSDVAVMMNKTNLVSSFEVMLKSDVDLTSTQICVLLNLLLSAIMGASGSNSDVIKSGQLALDSIGVEKLCFALAFLTQKYADLVTCKADEKLRLMDLDSDSEDDEQTHEQSMFSATEEHLVHLISSYLESQLFVSFISSLADLMSPSSLSSSKPMTSERSTVHFCSFVYNLNRLNSKSRAFFALPSKKGLMKQIWRTLSNIQGQSLSGQKIPMLSLLKSGHLSLGDSHTCLPLLASFCRFFSLLLITLDDKELFDGLSFPFSKQETLSVIVHLKDCALGLIEIIHPETKFTAHKGLTENIKRCSNVLKLLCQLLKQLHERDQRIEFSQNESFWISSKCAIPKAPSDMTICEALRRGVDLEHILSSTYASLDNKSGMATMNKNIPMPLNAMHDLDQSNMLSVVSMRDRRLLVVLTCLPFFISFPERIKLFRKIISLDKLEVHERRLPMGAGPGDISINIRRTHVYEDAFEYLSPQNEPDLRKRIRVTWRNVTGLDEAGIDGGGITRDFLQELIKAAFDPKFGFFTATPQGAFYPFPQVTQLMEASMAKQHFYFIGRMVGKVLYENLLVELPLASFFLAKILSGQVDINYLASMDEELHQNLLSLKAYSGNVEDLTLTFSRTQSVLGEVQDVELIPGGKEIVVDHSNKLFYIHTAADFWLNRQIKTQYTNFVSGLTDLISLNWLRMFNATEFQTLISGASISIDISDMRQNTVYAGSANEEPLSDSHPYVESFWEVVSSWDDKHKSDLLKFVTSCSRPPLLGFKEIFPPIAIHSAGPSEDRLPTASVCMNVLKLPVFPNKDILEEKLKMAVDSKSGFELS